MESESKSIKGNNGYYTKISKEILDELPLRFFRGEIYVINNIEEAEKAVEFLKTTKILGFDTETKPVFKRGQHNDVSILQISTHDKAFIFQLNKIGLLDSIAELLEDENVVKTGVAIRDDIKALQKLNDFKPGGFVELQSFVNQYGIEDAGLKKLTGNILGFRISKKARLSNWNNENLSIEQQKYAATDAWVGFEIYAKLIS